jgi:purine-binding chemotaxis protein CheW
MSEAALNLEAATQQFSTFYVSGRLYGINVSSVQEVTKTMPVTDVPLSPNYVHGLINLRGQIATAIGLRELFELGDQPPTEYMNVVCRQDGHLITLLVDQIGDVIELDRSSYEPTPDTVSPHVAQFLNGVYKTQGDLLSIIEVKKILDVLND